MNDFKKKLMENAEGFKGVLPSAKTIEQAKTECKDRTLGRYNLILHDKTIHRYLHNVVAAIMTTQYDYYPTYGINIPYRFKSPQSTANKVSGRIENATITYNENNEPHAEIRPLLDLFAMKTISRRRPPTFYTSDPEINNLIDERVENEQFLREMQKFKLDLIETEFVKKENYQFKYECPRIKYYTKCQELLLKIKSLIDPSETNVLEYYNKKILDINNRLDIITASHLPGEAEERVTHSDLTDKDVNFFELLSDFESRFYDKSDLAILSRQMISIFESDELLFRKLGVSLNDTPLEKKRTKNGYEANFIYLDTLIGTIECQLQTEPQLLYGNYGLAAHGEMKGKSIKLIPLPNVEDQEEVNRMIAEVSRICPKGYLARMDDNEPGRVMTQKYNDYQNYKSLVSQVAKGSPLEALIRNYFAKLYANRTYIFTEPEKTMGFVNYDIEDYLVGDHFKELQPKVQLLKSDALLPPMELNSGELLEMDLDDEPSTELAVPNMDLDVPDTDLVVPSMELLER